MAGKLVVVGGASAYTPGIIEAVAADREAFNGWEVVLYDIDANHLDIVGRLCRQMLKAAGATVRLRWTLDRAEAVTGAQFVLNQIRAGGLAGRLLDERIPLKYDVIGNETIGPGGMAYAWRSIPACVEIVRDVVRLAPGAWVINYANPAGMVTEGVLRAVPGAKIIGLCDMPEGLLWALSLVMRTGLDRLQIDNSGVNHQGWMRLYKDGRDITERLRRLTRWIPSRWVPEHYAMPMLRLLQRYGLIPSPYLRYYYFQDAYVRRAKAARRVRAEEVQAMLPGIYSHYDEQATKERPVLKKRRGLAVHGDLAVRVIAAMATGRNERHVINQINAGAVVGLPQDRVAEFPARITAQGFVRLPQAPLPPELLGLIQQVKQAEALAVDAALSGDHALATEAVAASPLVPGRQVAEKLAADLLQAHRDHLPQFFGGGV